MENKKQSPIIFSGRAHTELVKRLCEYLDVKQGLIDVFKFSNDNTFVRILQNVRQRDVFIVQPTATPVNDHIMEMLIMIDACKRASAGRITAVIPYYSYARTDKKDQPRVPITARLIADLIQTAGADRALLVDLHAGQVQGFFSFPVDELTALPMLANHFKNKEIKRPVVVAPDIGTTKRSRDFALLIDAPLAIIEKRRIQNSDTVQTFNVIGDVKGMDAILVDDEITSGGTMLQALNTLEERDINSAYMCATHGVFTNNALQKLTDKEIIVEIVVTDTMPPQPEMLAENSKVHTLTIAPLLGEAIRRINEDRSIGELFEN